jgi:hypothetical protein
MRISRGSSIFNTGGTSLTSREPEEHEDLSRPCPSRRRQREYVRILIWISFLGDLTVQAVSLCTHGGRRIILTDSVFLAIERWEVMAGIQGH